MTPDEFPIKLPRDRAIFRQPRWLVHETSAWIGHIPFAFWIVGVLRPATVVELGTHYGNSYFALVQAMDAMRLVSTAYAVDTWLGDDHSGHYGEEVFRAVHEHNERFYAHRSSLVRSTFDDAAAHFDAGEVDLLHIDGHHTYESVRHDFEHWRPTLSDRAVVLFHDVAVRERGFGVHRLFEELGGDFPTFRFDHSHGLGVAVVGTDMPQPLVDLIEMQDEDAVVCKEVFARLGDSVAAEANARARIAEVRASEQALREEAIHDREEAIHDREEAIHDLETELDEQQAKMAAQSSADRKAMSEEIARLRAEHDRVVSALEMELSLAEQRAAAALDARRPGGSA